jgi:hypothetical protein
VEIHPVWRYSAEMQRVVRIFDTFEDADRADRDYYASLTPQQRLEILLDLIQTHSDDGENQQGFARVHRVVELPSR